MPRGFAEEAGRRFAACVLWSGAEIKCGGGRGTRAALLALDQEKPGGGGHGADEHNSSLSENCCERSFATAAWFQLRLAGGGVFGNFEPTVQGKQHR